MNRDHYIRNTRIIRPTAVKEFDPKEEIKALRKINTAQAIELLELKKTVENGNKTANEKIIKDLCEVLDDICIGYKQSRDPHGLSILYTKLLRVVEKNGGEVYAHEGDIFTTDLHEAVGVSHTPFASPGIITEVYRHGIKIDGKIVMYAKVVVEGEEEF